MFACALNMLTYEKKAFLKQSRLSQVPDGFTNLTEGLKDQFVFLSVLQSLFCFLFFLLSSWNVLLWFFIIWSWLTLHLSSVLCAFLCLPHVQFLTKGCETSEMTLRRNGLGQLGFHVNYEGIVAEVPLCVKLRCSSKTVLINMFYNRSKFTLLAWEELLTHK